MNILIISLVGIALLLCPPSQTDAQNLFDEGNAAIRQGDIQGALNAFSTLYRQHPSLNAAQHNLAYTYKTMGNPQAAIPLYQDLLKRDPQNTNTLLGLSFAYLTNGNYTEGWQTYLKAHNKSNNPLRSFIQNNNLTNKIVLITYQGGLGDTIHFFRYTEKLKERGATVIAYIQKPLIPLLSRCPHVDTFITKDNPIPPHHAQATIMDLPALFEDNEQTIPKKTYLSADPALATHWQHMLNPTTFNIGICWHPDTHNDESRLPIARRDVPLALFDILKTIPSVTFYSLQKRDGLDQLTHIQPDFPLHVIDDSLLDEKNGPFMDTAAIIANLDLIITIDSAVAHLAGAMGKKVWLLLPYATDWRWLAQRTDSPWYPTMRIFKQPIPFDWSSVIQNLYNELILLIDIEKYQN